MARAEPAQVERVAVLGAGTIGASWTARFLARGLAVAVHDSALEREEWVRHDRLRPGLCLALVGPLLPAFDRRVPWRS